MAGRRVVPEWDRQHPESQESIIRQEVRKLRTLAAEARAAGDGAEARKLENLADARAQVPLPLRSKAPQRPSERWTQEKLWPND